MRRDLLPLLSFTLLALGLVAAADVLAERRARIVQASPAMKEELLRRQQRFEQFEPTEQSRLRDLAAAVETAPDAEKLRGVLERFDAWLHGLSSLERERLSQLSPDARLERIRRLKTTVTRLAAPLSPPDAQAMIAWIEHRVMDRAPPAIRQQLEALSPVERRRAIARNLAQRAPTGDLGLGLRGAKPGDFQELRNSLSPDARRQLEQAGRTQQALGLISDWIRQALTTSLGRQPQARPISQERLKQFFETELPPAQREELLSLPAEELDRRLRRLYWLNQQGLAPDASSPASGVRPAAPGRPARSTP